MGNLTTALTFVIMLNLLMFLTQVAIIEINPDASTFFTNEGTILSEFDASEETGVYVLDTDDNLGKLPSGEVQTSPSTGNLLTDMFSSITSWFAESTGLKYLGQVLSAPYNMLQSMKLPNAFVFAVGTMWYVLSLFLLISFIWGRDG